MTASTATAAATGALGQAQGRLQLVYAAHQELEDALSTLRAYATAARKHGNSASSNHEGFSPWAGLTSSAAQCTEAASRCLRLFSAARKVAQTKGLTAMARLYAAGTAPDTRVAAFLGYVQEAFDGVVPVEVALSGGRCLQKLDAATADDYLVKCISDWLVLAAAAPTEDAAQAFRQHFFRLLSAGDRQGSFAVHLRTALLLQIECAAQGEHSAHVLATYGGPALEALLSRDAVDSLQRYESACWHDAERRRAASSNAAATVPTAASPTVSTPATTVSPVRQQDAALVRAATEARRGPAAARAGAGASGWQWHALRIGVLLLLAVLVRFASGPLARALRSLMQSTRAAPVRQRTLTL